MRFEVRRLQSAEAAILLVVLGLSVSLVVGSNKKPLPPLASENECGAYTSRNGANSRISNGRMAVPGDFPSFASVGYFAEGKRFEQCCGGAFLGSRSVITAAHCVMAPASQIYVAGSVYPADLWRQRGIEPLKVSKICIHPQYKPKNGHDPGHNIAILILEKPVAFSKNIQPACLPQYRLIPNKSVIATGLGYLERGEKKRAWQLQHTTATYLKSRGDSSVSFKGLASSMCFGDSGAPYYRIDSNKMTIVGIGTALLNAKGSCSNTSVVADMFRNRNIIIDLSASCFTQAKG